MVLNLNFVIFIFVLVNFSNSQQQTPGIAYITPEQIKDIGETVTLSCTVQNANDFSVVWQKNNRERPQDSSILSIGNILAVKDKRFQLNYNENTTTFSLKISEIMNTDAGIYECKILVNITFTISQTVELQVRHPPIIADNLTTTTITIAEGQSTQLTCMAEGYPRPTITWKREYNSILPIGGQTFTGNVLKLNDVKKEDRGTYFCIAENGFGKGDSKNIDLEIEFAPVITVPRPKIAQAVDYDIELECVVQAYPSPAISWFKGGKQILNGDIYRISQTGSADENTISIVKISSLKKQQYGDFYCKASNKVGHSEARINLFEPVIPVYPWNSIKK